MPGGKTIITFKKKKPGKALCGVCGNTLGGVPNRRAVEMRRLPKTLKRPERPYGGVLCAACLKKEIVRKVRKDV